MDRREEPRRAQTIQTQHRLPGNGKGLGHAALLPGRGCRFRGSRGDRGMPGRSVWRSGGGH
jgi:hypothetical protein